MADYYELLQVHPKADTEAIRAAYERLRERYAPERLEGAADELVELARQRRDEIERAYHVLSDPQRRAEYDRQLQETLRPAPPTVPARSATPQLLDNDDDLIDYRPLPPARRQERPPGFNPQPYLSSRPRPELAQRGRAAPQQQPVWLLPSLIVAAATFSIVLGTLISTMVVAPAGNVATAPTATIVPPTPTLREILTQFDGQVIAAKQVADQVPDNPNAWINLGNALFDSVVYVREQLAKGDAETQRIYQERLPRWLEAVDAYRRALELQPDNDVVRADIAASLCYYGLDTNNPQRAQEGLAEAEKALEAAPQNARVLLSHGICLIAVDPPQTERALQQWRLVLSIPGVNPGLQLQAQILINEHSQ
ncbi:J domain-containing protein [Chloroflexus sp.]|uniref:J domain-containing protein n=1 Tax=Chloroflexus sp. TaxID=1904827 RepID=UPI00298F10E4|nr:DnaJ domain-containing protein [Chloroflexus sp.]MDW8404902.1 DnaJ domain-containing protein [Chloroflexus sp.]